MTISFQQVLNELPPEQRQQVEARVAALIAADPELQRLQADGPEKSDSGVLNGRKRPMANGRSQTIGKSTPLL